MSSNTSGSGLSNYSPINIREYGRDGLKLRFRSVEDRDNFQAELISLIKRKRGT